MNFGQAIEALKAGKKVARAGWNGKGMCIFLWKPRGRIMTSDGLKIGMLPCIVMFTAQGQYLPGWLASQTDILAEDWGIVYEECIS